MVNLDYITHNDGFIVISDNGYGSHLNIFKIKNVLIMYNIAKNQYKNGNINLRILKILKRLNIVWFINIYLKYDSSFFNSNDDIIFLWLIWGRFDKYIYWLAILYFIHKIIAGPYILNVAINKGKNILNISTVHIELLSDTIKNNTAGEPNIKHIKIL